MRGRRLAAELVVAPATAVEPAAGSADARNASVWNDDRKVGSMR